MTNPNLTAALAWLDGPWQAADNKREAAQAAASIREQQVEIDALKHDNERLMKSLNAEVNAHEPNPCAPFPITHEMGLWIEDYLNVLCEREALDISLPQRQFLNDRIDAVRACLASITFTEGAPRGAGSEKSFEVRNGPVDLPCDHCGHGIGLHVGIGLPCPTERTNDGR